MPKLKKNYFLLLQKD